MTMLHVSWYGSAVVATCLVWIWSRRYRRASLRALARTGVIAFGFTTVPLGRDGDGGLFPVGLFYLARGSWFEAAVGATLLIGMVWAALFGLACGYARLASMLEPSRPPSGRDDPMLQ